MAHHGTEEPPVYNPNHINTKLHFFTETMTGSQLSRTWVGFISSLQTPWKNTRFPGRDGTTLTSCMPLTLTNIKTTIYLKSSGGIPFLNYFPCEINPPTTPQK